MLFYILPLLIIATANGTALAKEPVLIGVITIFFGDTPVGLGLRDGLIKLG